MTRVPVHNVASAPEASRDTLKSLEAQFGKVLNIHGAMAASPVVLDSYAALQHSIGEHGTFDPKAREAIALVVAAFTRGRRSRASCRSTFAIREMRGSSRLEPAYLLRGVTRWFLTYTFPSR